MVNLRGSRICIAHKKVTAVYLEWQAEKTIRIGRPKFRRENEKIYVQGSVYSCVHMYIV
jgi:hypothetical protein